MAGAGMRKALKRLGRAILYTFVGVGVLLVLAAGAARLLLPNLEDYKPQVERFLSRTLNQDIAIAALSAEWDGLSVSFRAEGLRVAVEDHPGSGLRFGEILLTFEPLGVLDGARSFERLELKGPTIEVARLPDGRIRVGDTIIGTPRGLARRLLQGSNLHVTEGTVVWRDALSPADALKIEDVEIDIRSEGENRRFTFTASAPRGLVETLEGAGSYDPRSLAAGQWTGSLDVTVENLNLSRIPAVLQERLPWQSRGFIDTSFRGRWSNGVFTAASADVAASNFVIPYARDKTPLAARRFTSTLSWRRSDEDWRLVFTDPAIRLDSTRVSVSRFDVVRRNGQRIYSARDANVQDLLGVVRRLDIDLPWPELIDRLKPRGNFSQAALILSGPYLDAEGWRFEGDFRGVGWQPQERYPGVQGLNGHVTVDDKRGRLTLNSTRLEVDAARSLRHPVGFTRFEAGVDWYRWGGEWVVDVSNGVLGNDDLSLAGVNIFTRVPADGSTSPFVLGRARIERADIGRAADYLPFKRLTEKQTDWLEGAFVGGRLTEGRVYLNGTLDQFPFADDNGKLRIDGRVRDGELDFHEKWPNLTSLDGDVSIENSRFEARVESGAIMSSPISHARVRSDDFFSRDRELRVRGAIRARADDVIQFLRRGPLRKNPPPEDQRMAASGEGTLNLDITLPFTRLKEETRVEGDYSFQDVDIEVLDGVAFSDLAGQVRFTERSVEGQGLEGQLLGGPVSADVSTVEPGRPMTFAISGSGVADASRLTPFVGPVLVSRLDGRAQWSGRFVGGPGPNRVTVESDLAGVEVALPEPLWIAREDTRALGVTVEMDGDKRGIYLDMEDRLGGELHYERRDAGLVLRRGVLNLGGERALPRQGLAVGVERDFLDADQWIDQIGQLTRASERMGDARGERDALFSHLRQVDIDVDRLRYLNRDLGPVVVDAQSADSKQWRARLNGPRLEGTARIELDTQPASYDLVMNRLYWPALEKGPHATTYKESRVPSEFARVAVTADEFRYGDMSLGRLEFLGEPEQSAWHIRRLSLQQPETTLDATGRWSVDQFGGHRTRLDVSASSSHLGTTMSDLGLADQVASGTAELSATLGWPGEPGDFKLAGLDGELQFKAEEGRFLKLEPGSGRLLGLFNIDTLARRFRLDFADVFKEGLAFDRIDGEAEITSGRLHTDGIFIVGPAALMELSGSTNLAEKSYDMEVTVAPQWGGNLSLAGAIANPAAGAMIFVLQKLFKKQMAKIIHYSYSVTGDWDEPKIEDVETPAPDAVNRLGRN